MVGIFFLVGKSRQILVKIVDIELESGSILSTVDMMEAGLSDGLYGVKNGGQKVEKGPKTTKIDVSPYIFTGV